MTKLFLVDADQYAKLRGIADALCGGSDPMRDQGNKLWLLLGAMRAQPIDAELVDALPSLLSEATELLRNATYADGQATVLTQDCEALTTAIAKAKGN